MMDSLRDSTVSYGPVEQGSVKRQKTPPKFTVIDTNPRGGSGSSSSRPSGPYELAVPGMGQASDRMIAEVAPQEFEGGSGFEWDSSRCNWLDMVSDAHGNGAATQCPSEPTECIPCQGSVSQGVYVKGVYWCSAHASVVLHARQNDSRV